MVHETAGSSALLVLAIIKTLILFMGGIITFFAFKAYRRTGDRGLGLLSAGFAMVTIGALLGGMSFEVVQVSLATGIIIESVFVFIGFCLIAYSLKIER